MAKYQRRELLRGEGPGHGLKTVELQNVISSHLGMPLPTLHSLAKCMNLLCNNTVINVTMPIQYYCCFIKKAITLTRMF